DAEARDHVFCGIAEVGESCGVVARFVDGKCEVEFFSSADDGDSRGVAVIHEVETEGEEREIIYRKSVERDDDAYVGSDAESLREIGREGLDVGANRAAADAAVFSNLLVGVPDDAAGD